MNAEKPLESTPPRLFRKAKFGLDKFVLVQTFRIHYVEAGQGDPIILIPGSYGTTRLWKLLMPLLAVSYRPIALDYKLSGSKEKPGQSFEKIVQEQADILAKMIIQLKLEKVNLVGGGAGGAMVFDLAARYPELVNKVVSIGGYVTRPEDTPEAVGKSRQKAVPSSIIEEETKIIKAPIMYLYGTKTNNREVPLARNVQFLNTHLPQTWIISLEGGIFEIALENPKEIADLIVHFLRINLEPRKA